MYPYRSVARVRARPRARSDSGRVSAAAPCLSSKTRDPNPKQQLIHTNIRLQM